MNNIAKYKTRVNKNFYHEESKLIEYIKDAMINYKVNNKFYILIYNY